MNKKLSLTLTAMALMTALSLPAEAARVRAKPAKIITSQTTSQNVVVKKVIKTTKVVAKPSVSVTVVTVNTSTAKPTTSTTTTTTAAANTQSASSNSKVDKAFMAKAGVTSAGSLAAGDTYKVNNNIHFSEGIDSSGYFDFKNPTNDINKLVLGDAVIDLAPKSKNNKGVEVTRKGQDTLNVSHYLDYAKHGNYMQPNVNGESVSVIFYQGYETAKENIPTSGKATYKGVAVQSVIDVQNQRNNATSVQGKSEFNVDFANKTIEGKITPNERKYSQVQLAGKLKDNQIIGNDVNGYRSMEGRFYGPNAEEISGRYDVVEPTKQYVNGTFGAKKQ